jgi:hypothetical protein
MAATEKPDVGEVQAATSKLKAPPATPKERLPTAADIKSEKEQTEDVRAKAEAALAAGREKLKHTTEAQERHTLPTQGDIEAEQAAADNAADLLAKGKANLNHTKAPKINTVATEKPDAAVIRRSAKKLTQTETTVKQHLPTPDEMKAEEAQSADIRAKAVSALEEGKENLKSSATSERQRLPSTGDIAAELAAVENAESMLADGKAKLKCVDTRETNVVATEKPDASAIRGAAKKLTHKEAQLKQHLPTKEEIENERQGVAEEQAAAALAAGKSKLKPATTTVEGHLPTKEEINDEKAATEKAASILAEGKANLKHVKTPKTNLAATEKPDASVLRATAKKLTATETTLRQRLPTGDDIVAEKASN